MSDIDNAEQVKCEFREEVANDKIVKKTSEEVSEIIAGGDILTKSPSEQEQQQPSAVNPEENENNSAEGNEDTNPEREAGKESTEEGPSGQAQDAEENKKDNEADLSVKDDSESPEKIADVFEEQMRDESSTSVQDNEDESEEIDANSPEIIARRGDIPIDDNANITEEVADKEAIQKTEKNQTTRRPCPPSYKPLCKPYKRWVNPYRRSREDVEPKAEKTSNEEVEEGAENTSKNEAEEDRVEKTSNDEKESQRKIEKHDKENAEKATNEQSLKNKTEKTNVEDVREDNSDTKYTERNENSELDSQEREAPVITSNCKDTPDAVCDSILVPTQVNMYDTDKKPVRISEKIEKDSHNDDEVLNIFAGLDHIGRTLTDDFSFFYEENVEPQNNTYTKNDTSDQSSCHQNPTAVQIYTPTMTTITSAFICLMISPIMHVLGTIIQI